MSANKLKKRVGIFNIFGSNKVRQSVANSRGLTLGYLLSGF